MNAVALLRIGQALALAGILIPCVRGAMDTFARDPRGAAANATALLGAIALAWVRRSRLHASREGNPWVATAALALLSPPLLLSSSLDLLAPVELCWIGMLAALLYQERGREGLAGMRLPILMLVLAVPIPGRILQPLVREFLAWTMDATLMCLALFGIRPEVSGYTLELGNGAITLVRQCSGLDGLLLFIPLTILLLEASRPMGRLRYACLIATAAVVAFGANLARVVIESVLVHLGLRGGETGAWHEILGIATLALGAAAIWCGGRIARRSFRAAAQNRSGGAA
ncbi:MAG: hypothetical protein Fur0037_18590 [Planctomycetota bacterium]